MAKPNVNTTAALYALDLSPVECGVLALAIASFKPSNEAEAIARQSLTTKITMLLRAI